jgi:hypothetical protein
VRTGYGLKSAGSYFILQILPVNYSIAYQNKLNLYQNERDFKPGKFRMKRACLPP